MSEDLTKKLPKTDRDTQILTAIQNLDTRVGSIDFRIQGLETRVVSIDSRIQSLETRVGSMDSRIQGLEQKTGDLEQTIQERLHDTRPIWHKLVAEIGELQTGQQRLEKGQEAIVAELSELNTTVRNVNRDQIVINDVIRKIQLDFHIIDERLHRLEVNRNPRNSST